MLIAKISPKVDSVVNFINEPRRRNAARKSGNILVADADYGVPISLSQSLALDANHHNILTAQDGWEAVEMLQSFPIEILLTDLHMGIVSGHSLIDYVRLYYPEIQIFVMSDGNPPVTKKLD
ncbi:MAG: response regulator transcription factor [Dissulfurispiraceae bacterium]|jgi:DNA-binding NarL/FixJ family response regulator